MKNFQHELSYKTSRSSGSGGQNVNKVETSVTVIWKLEDSAVFTDFEKERILLKLKNKINAEGILQTTVSEAEHNSKIRKLQLKRFRNWLINRSSFLRKELQLNQVGQK